MSFMYEKDYYKLSKVEGFKPFFVLHQLLRKTLPPREGDSSRVPQYERNILHAICEEERFNVFDFIFRNSRMWLSPTTDHVPMHLIS
jgi:hypothetical protein